MQQELTRLQQEQQQHFARGGAKEGFTCSCCCCTCSSSACCQLQGGCLGGPQREFSTNVWRRSKTRRNAAGIGSVAAGTTAAALWGGSKGGAPSNKPIRICCRGINPSFRRMGIGGACCLRSFACSGRGHGICFLCLKMRWARISNMPRGEHTGERQMVER